MKKVHLFDKSERIYRVDKFVVPDHAREEFMSQVRNTHELLRTRPGFLQDFVLEQSSGPGEFNFVTIVEWDGVESIENAKAAVMAMHKEMNFNPQEMFARLGIKADLGHYRQIDA
jgi:heme-degrading monooxygenase HmoA